MRLAFALVLSAFAHVAVLANAPLAPGRGETVLFGAHPLTARIVSQPLSPPDAEPLQPQPEFSRPLPPVAPASPRTEVAQTTGLPSAQIYFRGSEVDERAVPLNEVTLVYPERALATSQSGLVTLRLKIDSQGVLRDAAIVDAQPSGVFERAAMEAVQALRFRPAIRNGVPVGSVKTIEVPFYPDCTRTGSCIAAAPEGSAQR